MMVPLNQAEINYYNYIIKSGILIILTILMWTLVAWRIWKLRKQDKVNKKMRKLVCSAAKDYLIVP